MKKLLGLTTAVAVLAISSVSFASLWGETTSAVSSTANSASKSVTSTANSAANEGSSLVAPTESALKEDPSIAPIIDVANNPDQKNLLNLDADVAGGEDGIPLAKKNGQLISDEMKLDNPTTSGAGYKDLNKQF